MASVRSHDRRSPSLYGRATLKKVSVLKNTGNGTSTYHGIATEGVVHVAMPTRIEVLQYGVSVHG